MPKPGPVPDAGWCLLPDACASVTLVIFVATRSLQGERDTVNTQGFVNTALRHATETKKARYEPASDRLSTATRFGGTPWWPNGADRPCCDRNHPMSFIAQIRLGDVPGFDSADQRLLSFHYCEDCAREGQMSFGWPDDRGRGYDLCFLDPTAGSSDGHGCVAHDWIGARDVSFESIEEIPAVGDFDEELDAIVPIDFFSYEPPDFDEYSPLPADDVYPGLKHVSGTKLGGHPSWLQNPDWPIGTSGERLRFVAQLDMVLCSELAWASGMAFLFAAHDGAEEAELVIQST